MLQSGARTRARGQGDRRRLRRSVAAGSAIALVAGLGVTAMPAYAVTTGTVVAWGSDGNAQTPAPAGLTGVVSVAGASRTSFAVKADGTVAAWGDDAFGLVTGAASLSNVTQVAGGERHALALHADGTVTAWGGATVYNDPTVLPQGGVSGAVQVAANRYASFALLSDGTVTSWGYLGLGGPSLTGVARISANGCQLLALKSDGSVVTWGSYCNGNPVGDAPAGTYVDVAAGIGFSAAVKSDGTVVTWNNSLAGIQSQGVVPPSGLAGVVEIAAGDRRMLARKADGTLVAWGYNYPSDYEVPAGLSGVTGIGGGDSHWLALTTGAPADSTPPVITPTITGTAGSSGWYRSDVSVSWTVTDAQSAVTSSSGCGTETVTTDTIGVTFTCGATSDGGSAQQSVTIKRDTVAPVLAPTVSPATVAVGGSATASANASDALSGIASQSCQPVSTSTAGTVLVPCTAADRAGNTATANASVTVTASTTTGPTLVYPAWVKLTVGKYVKVLPSVAGVKPAGYVVVSGRLPIGLSLDPSSGAIKGTPLAQGGPWYVTVGVKKSSGAVAAVDRVKFTATGGYLVRFAPGSYALSSTAKATLRLAAKAVMAGPGRSLEVRGYAAYINGDIAAAKLIASQRAASVKRYLRSLGVGSAISVSIGVGYASTTESLAAQRKATVTLKYPTT